MQYKRNGLVLGFCIPRRRNSGHCQSTVLFLSWSPQHVWFWQAHRFCAGKWEWTNWLQSICIPTSSYYFGAVRKHGDIHFLCLSAQRPNFLSVPVLHVSTHLGQWWVGAYTQNPGNCSSKIYFEIMHHKPSPKVTNRLEPDQPIQMHFQAATIAWHVLFLANSKQVGLLDMELIIPLLEQSWPILRDILGTTSIISPTWAFPFVFCDFPNSSVTFASCH